MYFIHLRRPSFSCKTCSNTLARILGSGLQSPESRNIHFLLTQRSKTSPVLRSRNRSFRLSPNLVSKASSRAGKSVIKAHGTASEATSLKLITSGYEPPETGLISKLPSQWQPYAELIRLDKPTGTLYLFFPCLFSTLMAASYSGASLLMTTSTALLFLSGALVMRGAGCTINDLWDRNLDPHVRRTRLRPIARGAISPFQATVFSGVQLAAGLGILFQFPTVCLWYGIPSLLLVATYPLAKRITYYPQLVLGFTFSWGAIMGFPALGIDLVSDPAALKAVAALYGSCISWTVLYDMIYAHMDVREDAKAGIKSIALRHGPDTKAILSGLALIQITLLATAGSFVEASPVFYAGSCASAAVALGIMISKVNLRDESSCWWWFKNGAWFAGGAISLGLSAEYLRRVNGLATENKRLQEVNQLNSLG